MANQGKVISHECVQCENTFETRLSEKKRGWGLFCSRACAVQFRHLRGASDLARLKASQAENWRRFNG